MDCIREAGGEVVAAAALIDRSAGSVDLGVPFFPLIAINFPTYAPDELPPELAATPAIKPGSRAKS
jgi:orotate phosphoribosyltransferase